MDDIGAIVKALDKAEREMMKSQEAGEWMMSFLRRTREVVQKKNNPNDDEYDPLKWIRIWSKVWRMRWDEPKCKEVTRISVQSVKGNMDIMVWVRESYSYYDTMDEDLHIDNVYLYPSQLRDKLLEEHDKERQKIFDTFTTNE